MSAKPETESAAAETTAEAPAKDAKSGGKAAWAPALFAIILAPALTWAVAQFVLIPQLKKELAAPEAGKAAAVEAAPAAKEGKGGKAEVAPNSYQFENIVVNLAGTMGTRYLKTTFLVKGADMGLKVAFEQNRAQLLDITLNVLSSLSLTDLEEVGSKNILREKLINAYNQALGKKMADQVYFSDFVIQ